MKRRKKKGENFRAKNRRRRERKQARQERLRRRKVFAEALEPTVLENIFIEIVRNALKRLMRGHILSILKSERSR